MRLRDIFRRFWPDTRPFRGRMCLSLALVAVGPALSTVSLYLFKILVDDVLTPHDYRLFPMIAAAYLGITVLGGLVSFVDEYLSAWVGEKFVLGLRVRLFAHLHRLSQGYFENHQLGDILSRLTGDVGSIEQLVLTGVNLALTYGFQIVFCTGAMVWLNWQLAIAAFVAAPGFLLIARSFSRRIQNASREQRRRSGSISAVAEESFGNVALVQAYDRADDEVERFAAENHGNFRAQMTATRLEAMFGPFSGLLEAVGVLLVMGIAVWELAQGRITLGGLLVFVAYLTQLYGPVQGVAGLSNSVFAASASAERIIELLDQEPAVVESTRPRHLGRATGAIGLENVGFAYPGTGTPALRGISWRIAPGRTIAVVGASGAGKSTLTKLLLRTYDPDRGRITLDGVDLRDLALSDLRRNVTAVLQETLVFDGTVAENIRWGRPEATDAEVVAAARAADAHEFVTKLADGYETRIGQRGRMLSGGQRQRLAIARAMIRNAPVLLLDEPTTGLDAESSHRVMAPLRRLMAGRTTIVISHNLLTVSDADEILFLVDGVITAAGSHEYLLRTCAGYAHLYALHHPAPPRPAPRPAPPSPRTAAIPSPAAIAVAIPVTWHAGVPLRPGPAARPSPRPVAVAVPSAAPRPDTAMSMAPPTTAPPSAVPPPRPWRHHARPVDQPGPVRTSGSPVEPPTTAIPHVGPVRPRQPEEAPVPLPRPARHSLQTGAFPKVEPPAPPRLR